MPDALPINCSGLQLIAATASIPSGEIVQMPDGRAGVKMGLANNAANDPVEFAVEGKFAITRHTSVVFLPGQEVWWDPTNDRATYRLAAEAENGFFVGTCIDQDTVAGTTPRVKVQLNVKRQHNEIDITTGFVGALTLTAGAPKAEQEGGELVLKFDTTAEAQRAEFLSSDSIPTTGDAVAEFEVNIATAGDDAAVDMNFGLANAGHASDADAITESILVHVDGASANLSTESDDGTTEVAADDTGVDFTAGTRVYVQMDMRDPADVQIYINGALVNEAVVHAVSAAAGPWKMLFHIEKSANDSPGIVRIRNPRAYRLLAV